MAGLVRPKGSIRNPGTQEKDRRLQLVGRDHSLFVAARARRASGRFRLFLVRERMEVRVSDASDQTRLSRTLPALAEERLS